MPQNYATPEMVKNFQNALKKEQKEFMDFAEVLTEMRRRNLLPDVQPETPEIFADMDAQDFMSAFDKVPLLADEVIDQFKIARKSERKVIFPAQMDILCIQHMHNSDYVLQTLDNVYSITYVFKGECHYIFNDEKLSLKQGNIFIASPRFAHYIHTSSDSFALEFLIRDSSFHDRYSDLMTANTPLSDFLNMILEADDKGYYCMLQGEQPSDTLRHHLQAIATECINPDVYSNACALNLLGLFLVDAFRQYAPVIYKHDINRGHVDAGSLITYIRTNYRNVSLSKMASHFHYNSTYMSRLIKCLLHKTYNDVLTEIRIQKARDYLEKTNNTIAEIAQLVGYPTTDHFSRTFKSHVGISPSEYRKSPR